MEMRTYRENGSNLLALMIKVKLLGSQYQNNKLKMQLPETILFPWLMFVQETGKDASADKCHPK